MYTRILFKYLVFTDDGDEFGNQAARQKDPAVRN